MATKGKGKIIYREGTELHILRGNFEYLDDCDLIKVETDKGIGFISKAAIVAVKPIIGGGSE